MAYKWFSVDTNYLKLKRQLFKGSSQGQSAKSLYKEGAETKNHINNCDSCQNIREKYQQDYDLRNISFYVAFSAIILSFILSSKILMFSGIIICVGIVFVPSSGYGTAQYMDRVCKKHNI